MKDVHAAAMTEEQLRERCDQLFTRAWDMEQQVGQERGQRAYLIRENERLTQENAELRRKGLTYAPGFVDA